MLHAYSKGCILSVVSQPLLTPVCNWVSMMSLQPLQVSTKNIFVSSSCRHKEGCNDDDHANVGHVYSKSIFSRQDN